MRKGVLYGLAFLGGVFLFLLLVGFLVSFLVGLRSHGTSFREAIGVVEIKGIITEADEKIRILEDFLYQREIKAVVVRVDSPGGTVGASQELYEELRRVAARKPVVVSMGSVAASGAYYVALGGTRIVASPGTITGSIGVILQVPNLKKLLQKIGVEPVVLKSGRFKDILSYYRSPNAEERKILEGALSEIHRQFMRAVAESRGLKLDRVREIADGRIFTGEKARELGLVDELGNFAEAVEEAARLAHIKGRPRLVYGRRKKPWWRMFFEGRERLSLENLLTSPLYLWMAGA